MIHMSSTPTNRGSTMTPSNINQRFGQYSTSGRFYFFDALTGKELADHPLNGCAAIAGSRSIADAKGRTEVRGMKLHGKIATLAWVDGEAVDYTITAADFDGPVIVKDWVPEGGTYEGRKFWLTWDHTGKYGAQPPQ